VDTTPYERIRVLAGCNAVTGGAAEIAMNFIQGQGTRRACSTGTC
jgi:hypothetical protein